MPDATGLELIAQELRDRDEGSVLDTVYFRDHAAVLARNRLNPRLCRVQRVNDAVQVDSHRSSCNAPSSTASVYRGAGVTPCHHLRIPP